MPIPDKLAAAKKINEFLQAVVPHLAAGFDVDPKKVRMVRRFELPKEALKAVERTAEARKRAEAEQVHAQSVVREAARRLAKLGVSLRDAGELLGLSHQRVQQLLQSRA